MSRRIENGTEIVEDQAIKGAVIPMAPREFRCQTITGEKTMCGRLLFRGTLGPGTAIELWCPTCRKNMIVARP